jgi:hypothetical protein
MPVILSQESIMIRIACIAATVSVFAFAAPAYAQDADSNGQQAPAASVESANGNSISVASAAVNVSGGWRPSNGAAAGLTRGEVRQQLVESERDGELHHLNTTIYKGN